MAEWPGHRNHERRLAQGAPDAGPAVARAASDVARGTRDGLRMPADSAHRPARARAPRPLVTRAKEV